MLSTCFLIASTAAAFSGRRLYEHHETPYGGGAGGFVPFSYPGGMHDMLTFYADIGEYMDYTYGTEVSEGHKKVKKGYIMPQGHSKGQHYRRRLGHEDDNKDLDEPVHKLDKKQRRKFKAFDALFTYGLPPAIPPKSHSPLSKKEPHKKHKKETWAPVHRPSKQYQPVQTRSKEWTEVQTTSKGSHEVHRQGKGMVLVAPPSKAHHPVTAPSKTHHPVTTPPKSHYQVQAPSKRQQRVPIQTPAKHHHTVTPNGKDHHGAHQVQGPVHKSHYLR